MFKNIIKCAIDEINKLNGEMKYEIVKNDKLNIFQLKVRESKSIVIENIELINGITVNKDSVIINEDNKTTIISKAICVYL